MGFSPPRAGSFFLDEQKGHKKSWVAASGAEKKFD
jgi:hypothetical protein